MGRDFFDANRDVNDYFGISATEFATSLRQQKAGHHEQRFHSRSFDERYDYQSQLQTEISQRTSITAGSVCIGCGLYFPG